MEAERISREFRRREKRHWIAVCFLVPLVFVTVGLVAERADPVWIGLSLGLLALVTGFVYRNWRCPACRRYLGSRMGIRFCAGCGARFIDSDDDRQPEDPEDVASP